jgi:hypothetical protein
VLETAEFGQTGPAVAMPGLADERDRSTRRLRTGPASECQDVDLVTGLVLTAGDDGLPGWAVLILSIIILAITSGYSIA